MQDGHIPKPALGSSDQAPSAAAPTRREQTPPIECIEGDFIIDATLIGELLNVPAADVPALMRNNSITSVCETGINSDQHTFRLNLFYRGRHARLRVDAMGRILQRSIIDYGERRLSRRSREGSTRGRVPPNAIPEASQTDNDTAPECGARR